MIAVRKQLREDAAAYIRRLILWGELRPGDTIPLDRVARDIAVSLTPVREAVLLLVQDGWVVQEPNRGFRVARIERLDVADAYLVNAFVVGELAARATPRISEAEIDRLRKLDRQIRTADATDVEPLDYQFHETIYRAADAPRLRWFAATASRLVPRDHWTDIEGWREFNRDSHAPIITAIEQRDVDKTRRLIEDHMHAAEALLIAHLDRTGLWREASGPDDRPAR